MSYGTAEARQELLDSVAAATNEIGRALAALGEAYELLDEGAADRLESELFGPVQVAYGRAKRTHTEFAARVGRPRRAFPMPTYAQAPTGAQGLIDSAVAAIDEADHDLAELQDSMRPVEVGDPELRAGLADVRVQLADIRRKARALERVLGR